MIILKHYSGGSQRALAEYNQKQAELEKDAALSKTVVSTAASFIPGGGAIAAPIASMLDNIGTSIKGDGTSVARNMIAMAMPLSQIGNMTKAIKTGDLRHLTPWGQKKLAEEANALQIKAAIDEYTDEIDPNGLGSIQNQVDLQQFTAARAKKGLKLKAQTGGPLVNIGKEYISLLPHGGKEIDIKTFLDWYGKRIAQKNKIGGKLNKKPVLLLTKKFKYD